MTKEILSVLYGMCVAILFIDVAYAMRIKDPISKNLRRVLILGLVILAIYEVTMFTNNPMMVKAINLFIFAAEGWILCIFLHFIAEFVNVKTIRVKVASIVAGILVVIDTIALLSNHWTNIALEFEEVWEDGELYVMVVPHMWFFAHLLICYGIGMVIFSIFFGKIRKVPKPYANAYRITAVMVFIAFAVNGLFLSFSTKTDISLIVYVAIGTTLLLFIYRIMPNYSIRQVKGYVLDMMDTPLLMFNMDDKLMVYNQSAEEILNVKKGMELSAFTEQNNLQYIISQRRMEKEKEESFSVVAEYCSRVFYIQGKELHDEDGKYVGLLFIYSDITIQERMKEEAAFQATHDSTTGLWNREYFFEMAEKVLQKNPDITYLVLASDIAQFKLFNEILGKNVGDDVLRSIAEGCKKSQTDKNVFGRITADRFAVLLPKDTFDEKRFFEFQESVFIQRGYSLKVRNYIGVYEVVDHSMSVEQMYDRAYMALESVKGTPVRFGYFDNQMRESKIDQAMHIDELEKALANKEFTIFIQPQVEIDTGNIIGGEALARWKSPKRGLVPPGEFIPVFEESGMITELDFYIWEVACKQLRKWNDEGFTNRSLSINISSNDFYMSDLYESLTGLVEKYNLKPECLKLEITESAIVLDIKEQMALVERLQDYGFLIEMDDFGSGYSSLNSLKNISVDILKLDMKFFGETEDAKRSERIIENMIHLAHDLRMPVIAEGVETEEQIELLKKIGCNIVQGYYYSKPLPVGEYERYISLREHTDISKYLKKLE